LIRKMLRKVNLRCLDEVGNATFGVDRFRELLEGSPFRGYERQSIAFSTR